MSEALTAFVTGSPEETQALGRSLAESLPNSPPCPAVLLIGELGAGKTAFTAGLVQGLPGGELAEVSSPSFTLANVYPTRPRVAHLDLYRLEGRRLDAEMEEILFDRSGLAVVEWAQLLGPSMLPDERLTITFAVLDSRRSLSVSAAGPAALETLARWRRLAKNFERS